ncbi:unnamed protein product [Spirodela intermedia]|uniref:Uncharacterized protein n=2 Tax=Spirodela intermedia TaxID=51605 RepID=A0A7I8JWF6_SPIIN|nr:unnamed protein product [Spirodela intermedia]CAA6653735.1 unnamed protein product [Spirodela intermedia]CAA7388095.1 unnamed protein product [Spirodela intermedia]
MSRGGGRPPVLAEDVPWRAPPPGQKPVPRIQLNPVLRVSQNATSAYGLVVMKHPNPVGEGFAREALLEAAGPDCIVPGQITPIKLLGLKVWPIDVNLKILEPVGRELQSVGKFLDAAVNLMNASFQDR